MDLLPAGKTESPTDALDGVSEWVLSLGSDGIVEWSNRAFIEFMGARGPDDTPWDLRQLFPLDEVIDDFQEIIRSGKLHYPAGSGNERGEKDDPVHGTSPQGYRVEQSRHLFIRAGRHCLDRDGKSEKTHR